MWLGIDNDDNDNAGSKVATSDIPNEHYHNANTCRLRTIVAIGNFIMIVFFFYLFHLDSLQLAMTSKLQY